MFGELWHVHGGGFYNMQKYTVAPPKMPDDLHWSKWPSYSTWMSGFGLFTVLYLLSPNTYLIDKYVLDMGPVVAIWRRSAFLVGRLDRVRHAVPDLRQQGHRVGLCVAVYVLIAAWLACHIFAGRAAYLHHGRDARRRSCRRMCSS